MNWIKGFVGISLIEYPGKIACALFTGGCPFRCPFCHNHSLVCDPGSLPGIDEADLFTRLSQRAGFCDGVVISGGEPLMHPGLERFIEKVRELGFAIKLDTNGFYPESLSRLLAKKLLDFVSMDIKSSVGKYAQVCGVHVDWWRIERSMNLLKQNTVAHEFRTTLVPGLVSSQDILEMAMTIGNQATWVLQSFRPQSTLDPAYSDLLPYSESEMMDMLRLAQSLKSNVVSRLDFDSARKQFNHKVLSVTA